jgi:hypothetical protein
VRDLLALGGFVFLACFGAIVGTCLCLLVAERQNKRRERAGLK